VTLETSRAAHIDDAPSTFILGDHARAQLNPMKILLDHEGAPVDVAPPVSCSSEDPHTTEIRAFIRPIQGGLTSPVPGEEAPTTTRIVDPAYESSRTGEVLHRCTSSKEKE
jgi:predicted dehydrogenase